MFQLDDDDANKEAIFLDLSGGIEVPMVNHFLTVVTKWMLAYNNDFEMHLVSFNCGWYNPLVVTKKNIGDILRYRLMGGGGTDISCCWDYMKTQGIKKCLIITDGLLSFGSDPGYDVSFIFHSNIKIGYPSYGKIARVS